MTVTRNEQGEQGQTSRPSTLRSAAPLPIWTRGEELFRGHAGSSPGEGGVTGSLSSGGTYPPPPILRAGAAGVRWPPVVGLPPHLLGGRGC